MATPNIVPRADSEGQLGTSSKYWAAAYIDLIYVGAGKIGRDADNLIDFSTDNKIQFEVAGSIRSQMTSANFFPNTNDGLALGGAGYGFSDLFLASGAVVNFDNSNVTLTHTSNTLTLADSDVLAFGADGDLQLLHDATNSHVVNYLGDLKITNNANDKDIVFLCDDGSGGNTAYLTLDGSQGFTTVQKAIRFDDNVPLQVGSASDFFIQHDGTNTNVQNNTGSLTIRNDQDDGDIIFKSDDGSGGVTTYFQLDGGEGRTVFKQNAIWQDNKAIYIGDGADLQINHNGTDSQVTNTTGNLQFTNTADDKDISFASDNGAGGDAIYFYLDGSSAIHDGSATTSLYTNWPDNSRISLGTGHDLRILHNGSASFLDNLTGDLYFRNFANDKDIIFQSDDGSGGTTAYLTLDGSATKVTLQKDLRADDNVKIQAGSSGDVYLFHNGTDSKIENGTGDFIIEQLADDKDIILKSDDGSGGVATYFTVNGGMANSGTLYTHWPDNSRIALGSENTQGDLNIYHNATDSFINNFTGDLYIRNNANDKDIIFQSDDGSGGIETYLTLDGSSGYSKAHKHILYEDSVKAMFGTGGDLTIQHDGSDSYISHGVTGDLYIQNKADDKDIILRNDDGSGGVATYLTLDGGLGYMVASKQLRFGDGVSAYFGNSNDMQIIHSGSHASITSDTGNLTITNSADDADIIFQSDDGSGGVATYFAIDGGAVLNKFYKDVKHLDSVKSTFGDGGDLQIYHDGSNSYIKDAGTGELRVLASTLSVRNSGDTELMITAVEDGAVNLYHNNVKKFETTAAGATFTGALTVDETTTNNLNIASFKHQQAAVISEVLLENAAGADNTGVSLNFKTAASGYGGKVTVLRTNSPSAGSADMILSSSGSEALRLDSSQNATFAGTITSTSATGNAAGAGFNTSGTVAINVGEINGEIITTIKVDLGTGAIVSSGTAGDVIGENDTEGAFLTRITTAVNGIVYRGEMICVEVPTTGDPDINLAANSSATLAEDGAGEGEHVLINGGVATLAAKNDITIPSGGIVDDYLYLTHGGTTAGTYDAGQFIIKLYGAATL